MPQNPYKRPDHFTTQAKQSGYPARSVFKLIEIDRRVRLFKPGMRVLDLGASPGSWSLYAAQKIGKSGALLAVDRKPLTCTLPVGQAILADALDATDDLLAVYAPYDMVLSDMAPNTSGNKEIDHLRSAELFCRSLEVAKALLRPGGSFVGKIFMGGEFADARKKLRELFQDERIIRPEGTRDRSCEIFMVGLNKKEPIETDP